MCQRMSYAEGAISIFDSGIALRQAWEQLDDLTGDGSRVYLVAFSNGNILAAEYTLKHPERIAGPFVLHRRWEGC